MTTVSVTGGFDATAPEHRRHILSDALAARFAPGYRPHEAAREFTGCSLREL